MTIPAVWAHMQSIGGGHGLSVAHESAALDNSVHLGIPEAYAAWMSQTTTLAIDIELMVLSRLLGAVIVIWCRRGSGYFGHCKLVPSAPMHVIHVLMSPTRSNAGHYEGFQARSDVSQPLHACVDLASVSPTGWDAWCKDAPAVQAALAPLRAEAAGRIVCQAVMVAGGPI
ncbi:hypothetical protein CHLRE_23g754697v5 [Chlamydomonas reinhardtii]|uniref:Uncharacterized protein n=1 Tax=Chlamydomonas reinhardtii TaxID=3055 RepID=A0A2K3CN66_CHLRE|nr:uncharacterized protein CHLRE_23g754697v5 [Chlamydomonas reinhardtii]XP_042914141.1 uncharacterized protein CHLRE_23g754697v5 [Chlamydomonas reinhardtii]PNW69715.1 hypothetical protein CHLRE_23g754697v5 [Chlamydomonas reinhardtii]PNW69716.1 hypothetical protein CHLRE_23g754697v5 [Chlamydomonas reinhardtii]